MSVTASSAVAVLLVPPSHNLILYSPSAGGGISIADLFAPGIVPALLLTAALMITGAVMARQRRYATERFPRFSSRLSLFGGALPGLLLVGVIFGGIRAGVFPAIESASIAVVYAVLVTAIVSPNLMVHNFAAACSGAVRATGLVMFVIGAAASLDWLLAYEVPAGAMEALTGIAPDKTRSCC